MIELDDRLLAYERVRAISAEWSEMLRAMDRCARMMHELGESNHGHALELDLRYLTRRAQLHLRQVAAHEVAAGISTRPPPPSVSATVTGADLIPPHKVPTLRP